MKQVLYFYKQLYSYVGKKLYLNLFGMVLISLLDGLGLLLLIPLIGYSGLINIADLNTSNFNLFSSFNDLSANIRLVVILFLFVLVNIIINMVQRFVTIENAIVQQGFSRYLRVEIYRDLLHANWTFYISKRKTDIINTITTELTRVTTGTTIFLQFITSIIFTIIQIGIAFLLSSKITLFVIGSGLLMSILSRGFIKRSNALGRRTSENGRQLLAGITDNFNGIKEIKSNNLEESRIKWFNSLSKKIYVEQVDYIKLKTSSQLIYKIASSVLIAIFIFTSIKLFQAQTAQLMLILLIFSRLWPRVTGIQTSLEQIAIIVPALKTVIRLKEESMAAKEFDKFEEFETNRIEINKGITCKEICFSYKNNIENYALKNINAFFKVNCMTAIVGPSGAGKSTLIDLIMGLNQPESGDIEIDGMPLTRDNLLSFRQSISYVPQDPFLFNTTIRENLLLTKPLASEEELWESLDFASADFVRRLPQGLDTLIGDRGIRLSGGERQRIVLARAILRNPTVLLLDEATSSLDTENERNIQESLEQLKGKLTIIVIAHRLSTIKNADHVIVLEKGKIKQVGNYIQLAQERGVFGHLLGRQLELTN